MKCLKAFLGHGFLYAQYLQKIKIKYVCEYNRYIAFRLSYKILTLLFSTVQRDCMQIVDFHVKQVMPFNKFSID